MTDPIGACLADASALSVSERTSHPRAVRVSLRSHSALRAIERTTSNNNVPTFSFEMAATGEIGPMFASVTRFVCATTCHLSLSLSLVLTLPRVRSRSRLAGATRRRRLAHKRSSATSPRPGRRPPRPRPRLQSGASRWATWPRVPRLGARSKLPCIRSTRSRRVCRRCAAVAGSVR